MLADFWLVFRWWGTLFLVGAVAFPLTKRLFSGWFDHGYLFAKAVGMATVTFLVYLLARVHLVPFTEWSIAAAMGVVFVGGMALQLLNSELGIGNREKKITIHNSVFTIQGKKAWKQASLIFFEELFFFVALIFWSWIKAHEPSIHGLEKFMDYGFMKSILNSAWLPAPDMWYAGLPINYYYFGHTVVAVLTKLSGIDLAYTFNIMLATLFALTLTMSFSIGAQVFRLSILHGEKNSELGIGNREKKITIHNSVFTILSGLLTAFLVTLAGNMQTLYAFTRGYSGDEVKPFWELAWKVGEFWQKLPEGMMRYWYANATRFIPYTIHEFPSYSFVVSDLHGHVLSIPFVLLAIALLVQVSRIKYHVSSKAHFYDLPPTIYHLVFYGFLCGVLLMTNALDGPIYAGLFVVLSLFLHRTNRSNVTNRTYWRQWGLGVGVVALSALATSFPFLSHFNSFVSGVAVNCPPAFLTDTKVGPLLFESVEKCQHSPLWMMALLWGFFWFCGGALILKIFNFQFTIFNQTKKKSLKLNTKMSQLELLLLVFFGYSMLLIIFPEFFYFKDIYPQHFRSNTMFKLGYEAFIMFSIVAGYVIVSMVSRASKASRVKRTLFFILLIPQLFLVSIYPIFSVRSYFGELKEYHGLDGLAWLRNQYPGDYAGIQFLNQEIYDLRSTIYDPNRFAILEADGDSYTDYARYSAFTGLPTVIGWPVHEWLWRGSYDVVAPRREDVRLVYESTDMDQTRELIKRYHILYIIVGTLEREKFKQLQEVKISELGDLMFQQGATAIYRIRDSAH